LESNSRQPRNPTEEAGKVTATTRVNYSLSCGVLVKGKLVSMKVMMMNENQSSLSQVHVTVILGTDKTMLRTQFKLATMPAK
jgi:hypothetical protein